MSLAAAVNVIVEAMEKKAASLNTEHPAVMMLEGFAAQFRIAVTASGEGEFPRHRERQVIDPGADWDGDSLSAFGQRLREGPPPQQAPRMQRAVERLGGQLRSEDNVGERMALCVGGPADGDTVPLNPQMPEGAYTVVGGGVYQLRKDGQVHYDEERTQRMKEQGI